MGFAHDAGLARWLEMAMRNSVEKLKAMLEVPILVEGARVEPPDRIRETWPLDRDRCVAVLLGIRGDVQGSLLVALPESAASELCEMAPQELKQFLPEESERMCALLEELANLLFSTYLDVFSEVAGLRLLPTPPEFQQATGPAIASGFLSRLGSGQSDGESRLLVSALVMRSPQTRMLVASAFPGETISRLVKGARRQMPELF